MTETDIIESRSEARDILAYLTPEQADMVYDYCVDGAVKYGTPITLEALEDNAAHLAEEEGWFDD